MDAYTDGRLKDSVKKNTNECNCVDLYRVHIENLKNLFLLCKTQSETDEVETHPHWSLSTCHIELVGQQMCVSVVAWCCHGRKQRPHILSKVILLQDATREQVSTHPPHSQSPAIYTHTHTEPELSSMYL